MLCDNCGERPASIKITTRINGETVEKRLCEECAKKQGINVNIPPVTMAQLFAAVLGMQPDSSDKIKKCPTCSTSFSTTRMTGHLGCPDCYESFKPELEASLRQFQKSSTHVGKVARNAPIESIIDHKLEELTRQLNDAVREERYEDAIKLRDQIKMINGEADT
ncbi:MAG: hypothetical protein E7315_01385 [Clostridiales bacterium]|nr:hypothetical protein [Clostridiales bacterium]